MVVDVPKVSLSRIQLEYLSHSGKSVASIHRSSDSEICSYLSLIDAGSNYIRPNQSHLHSYAARQKQVKREFNSILDVITPYLIRVHHMAQTSSIMKVLSQQLATYLCERYMAPMSYLHIPCARRELKILWSPSNAVGEKETMFSVSPTKVVSSVLTLPTIMSERAEASRRKTEAYFKLDSDPLWIIFDKAIDVLNDLRSKKHIMAWQLKKRLPKREKVALAYLYFVPRPHKVNITDCFLVSISLLSLYLVTGRNAIETHRVFDAYAYHWHLQVPW